MFLKIPQQYDINSLSRLNTLDLLATETNVTDMDVIVNLSNEKHQLPK